MNDLNYGILYFNSTHPTTVLHDRWVTSYIVVGRVACDQRRLGTAGSRWVLIISILTFLIFTYGDNLSDVSDPQLELSDKSVLNFLAARGEDGAFLAHIWV